MSPKVQPLIINMHLQIHYTHRSEVKNGKNYSENIVLQITNDMNIFKHTQMAAGERKEEKI